VRISDAHSFLPGRAQNGIFCAQMGGLLEEYMNFQIFQKCKLYLFRKRLVLYKRILYNEGDFSKITFCSR